MSTSNEKAISILNELIETCKDGQKGFTEAAEGLANPVLKVELQRYASQRAEFATQLQQQVRALGGNAETSGSAAGALHRGWIDLKAAITGKDEHAILAECERGEDVAKKAYEDALEGTDLPGTLLPQIQQQYSQVEQAHDRVRDLRDSLSPASR